MKTTFSLRSLLRKSSPWSFFAIGAALFNLGSLGAEQAAAPEAGDAAGENKPAPQADQKAEKKEEAKTESTEYRNWFDLSVGGVLVDGDKGAFQRRYGLPGSAFGGVEDFHYEEDIGKKGIFKVDGRGVFDNHDYSLKFDVEHPDIGFVRGGYREFRSYYDGSGGFFPGSGSWFEPYADDLFVDRGEAFFEAGLTLPNKPNVTFRYDHMFRDGRKDSTSWGDLSISPFGTRKIVPSFRDLNETRDIFQLDAKHTIKDTTFGAGVRYEFSKSDDSLNVLRNPGQTGERYGTDRERIETDMFNVHAFSDTRFNEKVALTVGYSFTTLDTDLSGYRVYGTGYDPAFAQRLPVADSFESLGGGSELNQHVANVNVPIQLADALMLIPSLRIEREDTEGTSSYDSPAAPLTGFPYGVQSQRGLLDVSERLELRYTGLTNWVFYTRGEWLEGSGDLQERWDNLGTTANVVARATDSDRFWQTYTAGANWYPMRRLNFGAQYYHKERSTDYSHTLDSTPNILTALPTSLYPAFLTAREWATDDANFRATWRALPNLTLVGRYDFQYSTFDSEPDPVSGLSEVQTARMTSHIVGGSASWSPLQRLYLQAGLNFVWDQTDSPAQDATDAIHKAKNDYWTANLSAGYALDNKTDLELQYLYYRADNRIDNSVAGMPYNADAQEQGITAAIIRRITERMRITLKYGFFDGRDWTSGGHNDYQAHLIYSSFHYRF